MNTSFERILDLERSLIRGGLSLPVGGSLLLIARRGVVNLGPTGFGTIAIFLLILCRRAQLGSLARHAFLRII